MKRLKYEHNCELFEITAAFFHSIYRLGLRTYELTPSQFAGSGSDCATAYHTAIRKQFIKRLTGSDVVTIGN